MEEEEERENLTWINAMLATTACDRIRVHT